MDTSQLQVEAMEGAEAGTYAKFGPTGATDQDYHYSSLKVHKNYSVDHVY